MTPGRLAGKRFGRRAVQKITRQVGKEKASDAVKTAFERSPDASVAELAKSAVALLKTTPRKHK